MRILVDTDVLIDLALDRRPHEIAPTTTDSLRVAGRLPLTDFEDAMQVAAALACGAEAIATRNVRDYARSPVEAVLPATLVRRLS